MIGAEERRKLISRFASESINPLIAVLRCLAALIALVVIAAMPWAFLTTNNTSGADAQTTRRTNAALAESKRVFDERRQAREAARPGGKMDSATLARERPAID